MHLRTRLERIGLSGAMALPEPAQRALAGRPVTIDGNTLATDVQLMLRLQRLARLPGAEELPLAEGREVLRATTAHTGGDQPIGSVRSLRGRRPAGPALRADRRARGGPAAGLLPRRRVLVRRPRHPRRDLPVPRRAGGGAGALGGLPARPRAPVPRGARRRRGGVRLDRGARRRARRRPGPARRRRRLGRRQPRGRRGDRGGPARLAVRGAAARLPGHPGRAQDPECRAVRRRLLPDPGVHGAGRPALCQGRPRRRPPALAAARRAAGRPGARARLHRRVRPAPRRGRGVRRPAARGRGRGRR